MAYRQVQLPQISNPQPNEFRLDKIEGGYCITDIEQNLKDNQSAKLLNMWWNGSLSKRQGQAWLNSTAVEANPIYQAYEILYKGKIIYHCDEDLYTSTTAGVSVSIYTGVEKTKGTFVLFNDYLYYFDGVKLIQWNGNTATLVTPYIPTILINRTPSGGGTVAEGLNRIGAGFKTSFNGVTDTAIYQLPYTSLDATAITATVGGVAKVETTDFTVNRTTGVLTFSAAPTTGTNNVIITAYKTNSTYVNTIFNSKLATVYGGTTSGISGGTRVIVANGNVIYYSGLLDATYYPDVNYNVIGTSDEPITCFGKTYNILVFFKAHSTYKVDYSFDGTTVLFIVSTINANIGCDMPYTVQLIKNSLVWWNTYAGCQLLASTVIVDERNILPISYNINGTTLRAGALQETLANKQAAVSCDSNGRYWTCIGTHVYLWDYSISPYVNTGDVLSDAKNLSWFYFDSITANCFITNNQDLYYGDQTTGRIAHFIDIFADFGSAISAVYRLPLRDMGAYEWLKTIRDLYINCRADTFTSMSMTYISEQDPTGRIDSQPIVLGNFTWSFAWSTFTWDFASYVKQFHRRPSSKKIDLFACEFSNSDLNRDLNILNLVFTYTLDKKKK